MIRLTYEIDIPERTLLGDELERLQSIPESPTHKDDLPSRVRGMIHALPITADSVLVSRQELPE